MTLTIAALIASITVFVLAIFLGFELISKVPPTLHTPLMSGANAISGEFSFGASGYLCENGERFQPVRNVTVAGNFYQMLQNINMIGNRQHWNWQRSALMPSIRFADVAISG